ncbi:MAG: transcriptional activator RfaH [Rhizobiales bacterium]|nr:transcriptional activator RfaH [Hyphomicrobiales bacterium]
MSAGGTRWHVVQTHPHAEQRAETHLQRQGFVTYLPRYLKRRRHARRVETVAAPLFPRYLFVAIDLAAQRWRSIRSTVGVSYLVCNGNDPAALPDAVIAQLRDREESGLVRLPARPPFRPGESVRILDGAFASCLGLYDGMRDGERVTVLLDLLGRKVRLVLDVDSVAAA